MAGPAPFFVHPRHARSCAPVSDMQLFMLLIPPPATCGSTAAARRGTGVRDATPARRGNTETVTEIHNWHPKTMMRTDGIRFARPSCLRLSVFQSSNPTNHVATARKLRRSAAPDSTGEPR